MPNKRTTTIEEETPMASPDDSPRVRIAVMNNDIKHISDSMNRLEAKFDAAIANFVTNQQLQDTVAAKVAKHKEYESEFVDLKESVRNLQAIDNKQQGAIEANQKYFSRMLVILTALAAILGALWWIPTVLHR